MFALVRDELSLMTNIFLFCRHKQSITAKVDGLRSIKHTSEHTSMLSLHERIVTRKKIIYCCGDGGGRTTEVFLPTGRGNFIRINVTENSSKHVKLT
jgi:hypothetical protein